MNTIKTGKFLSQKRKEKGLTQLQLANKINVNPKIISKWEFGYVMPSYDVLDDLCKVLSVTASDIINGEKDDSHLTHEEGKYLFKLDNNFSKNNLLLAACAFMIASIPILFFIQILSTESIYHICVNLSTGPLLSAALLLLMTGYVMILKYILKYLLKDNKQKRK